MDDEQMENTEAIRLADTWAGRRVTISGVGGAIGVDSGGDFEVTTAHGKVSRIVIERAPEGLGLPNAVAFRVFGTQKYLTNIMYGDRHRQQCAEALAAVPGLLPVHIPEIVAFAIGRPTGETNFEGPGFNYCPMTVQDGPPTKLQLFVLESVRGANRFGVKSLFGTYWRSQHWVKKISQSPHLLGDETWYFCVQDEPNRRMRDW
jgi:hypothetical protein